MAKITGFVRHRFLRFRREVVVLWFAFRHPDTPLHLKIASVLLSVFVLSRSDLIIIVVPILGLLDDLVIVAFGVSQVVKRLRADVLEQTENDASRWIKRYVSRPLLALAVVVAGLVTFWGLIIYWLFF